MTPDVCRAARALTGLTQRELASAACISTQTIADFERGARQPHYNNLKAIRQAFETMGIEFVEHNEQIIGMNFAELYHQREQAG